MCLTKVHFSLCLVWIITFVCAVFTSVNARDRPCLARPRNDSVDCVCNATYCDEITRERPSQDRFFAYTTSKSGLRFTKSTGSINYCSLPTLCPNTLYLDPRTLYQTIEGFGGAVSDSSAAIWVNLTNPQLKKKLIESYFGSTGLEFNMARLPMGATDFSPSFYTYQDQPENDATLSNFSLTDQDYKYKIPMLKAAMKIATAPIHILGSMWAPPIWMKTIRQISGVSLVKKEYFGALANYYYKFLEQYAAKGVDIWGLTTLNEPLSGVMSLGNNTRVTWTTGDLGIWIAEHLGPTLRNSVFKNVKLIIGDDMRLTVPMWFNLVVMETPEALQYIDGVGVHFYFDEFTAPDVLTYAMRGHEDKYLIYTEASLTKDELSAWNGARRYILNIIEDLNYNVTGFIDWNLCLYPDGESKLTTMKLDAPIIVSPENGEFTKLPIFYALGHFSKFLPRGSRRISAVEMFSCGPRVENVSFLTPENTVVTILYNGDKKMQRIQIKVGYKTAIVTLAPVSVTTVELAL